MMKFIRAVIAVVITVLVAVFAAFNRSDVFVVWNPIEPEQGLVLPLYAIVLGAMVFGFLVGALMVWLNSAPLRKQKRQQKREIKKLEREVCALKDDKFSEPDVAALPSQ